MVLRHTPTVKRSIERAKLDFESDRIAGRESITFILGEDKEFDNPFYAEASNYYLYSPEGKTEHVINSCRSLLEVQHYLTDNKPSNDLPWGLINLVSHGNRWLGLSVKVTPDSKRATTERIRAYSESDSLIRLTDDIIDENTEIFIHACGLGQNREFLNLFAETFAGSGKQPVVKSSKLFEFYTSSKHKGIVRDSRRYYAEAPYITYKMGYRPDNKVIVNLLRRNYPGSQINFEDALSREQARFIGDTYHYTFEVPVKWVIAYEDSSSYPDLSSKELQRQWINEQKEITNVLQTLEIPVDHFNWWFRDVYVNNEDGSRSPAVWLKGYCTILCVIRPLVNEPDSKHMLAFNDGF
jgi:hypothetical protein